MTITKLLLVGAFAGVVLWGANRHFDPYSTKLPLDSPDLSVIQDKLDKLPPDERELVLAYVHRTGGRNDGSSMLIATQLATMPNLKEAIGMQKAWLAKEAKLNVTVNSEFAAYNSKFDAMRKALQIELVGTQTSRDQAHTFSFKNKSSQTIEAFEARVLARQTRLKLDEGSGPPSRVAAFAYPFAPNRIVYLPAGYTRPVLIPFASVEMNTATLFVGNMQLGKAPEGEMILETYPTYIRFANGQELKIPDEVLQNAPNVIAIYGRLLKE
ncbi:MAG TPA: hypothetical protein VN283_02380 [Thiobacillus sp.]|nr:hypothetical protein [Thiobacillus sp.]